MKIYRQVASIQYDGSNAEKCKDFIYLHFSGWQVTEENNSILGPVLKVKRASDAFHLFVERGEYVIADFYEPRGFLEGELAAHNYRSME